MTEKQQSYSCVFAAICKDVKECELGPSLILQARALANFVSGLAVSAIYFYRSILSYNCRLSFPVGWRNL
jgi:hypothetical protein